MFRVKKFENLFGDFDAVLRLVRRSAEERRKRRAVKVFDDAQGAVESANLAIQNVAADHAGIRHAAARTVRI